MPLRSRAITPSKSNSFVPREQIDQRYLDSPYYVIPNDQAGQDAFAVIREAMRGKGTVALGRVVLAKRERVIMLEPWDKGLMGTPSICAICTRSRTAERVFRRHSERESRAGHAQAGRAHPANQGSRLRSVAVRGRLCKDAVVEMLGRSRPALRCHVTEPFHGHRTL